MTTKSIVSFLLLIIAFCLQAQTPSSLQFIRERDTVVTCTDTLRFSLKVTNISSSSSSPTVLLQIPSGMILTAVSASPCPAPTGSISGSSVALSPGNLASGDTCRYTFSFYYACVSVPDNWVRAMISSGPLADTVGLTHTVIGPYFSFQFSGTNSQQGLPQVTDSVTTQICNLNSIYFGELSYQYQPEIDIEWDSIRIFSLSGSFLIINTGGVTNSNLLLGADVWQALFTDNRLPDSACFRIRTYYRRICTPVGTPTSSSEFTLMPACGDACFSRLLSFNAQIPVQTPASLAYVDLPSGTAGSICNSERNLRFAFYNPIINPVPQSNLKRVDSFQLFVESSWFASTHEVWVNDVDMTSYSSYYPSTDRLVVRFNNLPANNTVPGLDDSLFAGQSFNSWHAGDSLIIEVRHLVLQDDSSQGLAFQSCNFSVNNLFVIGGGNAAKHPRIFWRDLCASYQQRIFNVANFTSGFDADAYAESDTTDIQVDETVGVDFCFIPQGPSRSPWNIKDNQGNSLYPCPGHTTQFVLHLPIDLIPVGIGDSTPAAIVSSSVSTDTILFTTTGAGWILAADTFTSPLCIRVFLQLNPAADCPSGGFNLLDFRGELRAVCDTACANQYITMACASSQLFRHCPGECDGLPMNIASISLRRQVDATLVGNLNQSVKDKRAYACDTLILQAEGQTFSTYITQAYPGYNPQSAFLALSYPNLSGVPDMGFVDGYFVIRDLSAQPLDTLFLSATHFQSVFSAGNRLMRLFLPVDTLGMDSLYLSSYRLSFYGRLRVNPFLAGAPSVVTLPQIRGEFKLRSQPPGNGSLVEAGCCDPLGTSMMLLNVGVNYTASIITPESPLYLPPIDYCQYQLIISLVVSGGLGGSPLIDDFPNEFRPVIRYPDSATLTLPSFLSIASVTYQSRQNQPFVPILFSGNQFILSSISENDDAGYISRFRVILNSGINPTPNWTVGLSMPFAQSGGTSCGSLAPNLTCNAIAYGIDPFSEYRLQITSAGINTPGAQSNTVNTLVTTIFPSQQPWNITANLNYDGGAWGVANAWVYPVFTTPGISISQFGNLQQTNGYYRAGNLPDGVDFNQVIPITYPCSGLRDTIDFIYGFSCYGYDSLTASSLPPNQNPYARIVGRRKIILRPQGSDLKIFMISPPGTFQTCESRQVTLRLRNQGNGALYNPVLNLLWSNGLDVLTVIPTGSVLSGQITQQTDQSLQFTMNGLIPANTFVDVYLTITGDSCQRVGDELLQALAIGSNTCGVTDSSNFLAREFFLTLGLCCSDTCLATDPLVSVDSMHRDSCNLRPGNSLFISWEGYAPANPYTFSWSNGTNATSGLYNVLPGSYTYTVTNAFGCEYTDTVVIPPSPHHPDASFTVASDSCLAYTFTASDTTGLHIWSYGDNHSADTGAYTIFHRYAIPGRYEVIHQKWDKYCGWIADTQVVEIPLFCCLRELNTDTVVVNQSASSVSLSIQNNQAVLVNNCTLTIDNALSLSNCIFVMAGADAAIHVPSGGNLNLQQSQLYGCYHMWRGISVNGEMTIGNNSLVSDALIGISSTDCAVLDVTQTVFENNWIGVEVADCLQQPYTGVVNENTFTKASQPLLPPGTDYQPGTGIRVRKVKSWAVANNSFDSLNCGINSLKSSLQIQASNFRNIHCYNTHQPISVQQGMLPQLQMHHGSGVYLVGQPDTALSATFTASVSGSVFVFGDRGVYSRGINELMVLANTFHSITNAVYAGKTRKAKLLSVILNTIEGSRLGIHLSNNPSSKTVVSFNKISCSVPVTPSILPVTPLTPSAGNGIGNLPIALPPGILLAHECIRVDEGHVKALSNNISNNNTTGGAIGIGVYGVSKGTQIIGNDIQLTDPIASLQKRTGIFAQNSDLFQVKHNTIKGNNAAYQESGSSLILSAFRRRGIAIEGCKNYTLRCNQMETIGYGMEFLGKNITSDDGIAENRMLSNSNGMVMRKKGSDLGMVSANCYVGTPTLVNRNVFHGLFFNRNSSTWGWFISQNNQWWNSNSQGRLTWVFADANLTGPNTKVFYPANIQLPAGFGGASGPGINPFNQIQYEMRAELASLNATIQQGCLVGLDSTPPVILSLQAPLSGADSLLAAGLWQPQDFPAVSLYSNERQLFSRLKEDSLLQLSPLLASFKGEKEPASIGLFYRMDSLSRALSDSVLLEDTLLVNNHLQTVRSLSVMVPEEQDIVGYEKRMRQIYLRWLEEGNEQADSADLALIHWLALQCPLVAGDGVYQARNLWGMLYEDGLMTDDAQLCQPFSVYKTDEPEEPLVFPPDLRYPDGEGEATDALQLSPNPAGDEVQVYWSGTTSEEGRFGLYNFHGHLLQEFSIFGYQPMTTLSLSSYPAGSYVIRGLQNSHAAALLLIIR